MSAVIKVNIMFINSVIYEQNTTRNSKATVICSTCLINYELHHEDESSGGTAPLFSTSALGRSVKFDVRVVPDTHRTETIFYTAHAGILCAGQDSQLPV
jgi:hypothetical protein